MLCSFGHALDCDCPTFAAIQLCVVCSLVGPLLPDVVLLVQTNFPRSSAWGLNPVRAQLLKRLRPAFIGGFRFGSAQPVRRASCRRLGWRTKLSSGGLNTVRSKTSLLSAVRLAVKECCQ